jgi:hypothetical protein
MKGTGVFVESRGMEYFLYLMPSLCMIYDLLCFQSKKLLYLCMQLKIFQGLTLFFTHRTDDMNLDNFYSALGLRSGDRVDFDNFVRYKHNVLCNVTLLKIMYHADVQLSRQQETIK